MNEVNVKAALTWLLDGETGASSKNIVRFLLTGKSDGTYPLDPADLRRCFNLLNSVDGLAYEFSQRMKNAGPVWKNLTANWSLLASTFYYEVEQDKIAKTGNAPKTYQLMTELIDSARKSQRVGTGA